MTQLSNAFLRACLGVSCLLPSAWGAVEPSKLQGNHKMSASLSILGSPQGKGINTCQPHSSAAGES